MIGGSGQMAPRLGRDGYRPRHAQSSDHVLDTSREDIDAAGDAVEPSAGIAAVAADDWTIEEGDGPEDFRLAGRPYTWTRGRTRPVVDLAVETLVSTTDEGRGMAAICSAEHAAIAQLCTDIRSVAEVAALLALPLGVARVLLADMIDIGLLYVHRNPLGRGDAPDMSVMERVLAGLYRL